MNVSKISSFTDELKNILSLRSSSSVPLMDLESAINSFASDDSPMVRGSTLALAGAMLFNKGGLTPSNFTVLTSSTIASGTTPSFVNTTTGNPGKWRSVKLEVSNDVIAPGLGNFVPFTNLGRLLCFNTASSTTHSSLETSANQIQQYGDIPFIPDDLIGFAFSSRVGLAKVINPAPLSTNWEDVFGSWVPSRSQWESPGLNKGLPDLVELVGDNFTSIVTFAPEYVQSTVNAKMSGNPPVAAGRIQAHMLVFVVTNEHAAWLRDKLNALKSNFSFSSSGDGWNGLYSLTFTNSFSTAIQKSKVVTLTADGFGEYFVPNQAYPQHSNLRNQMIAINDRLTQLL